MWWLIPVAIGAKLIYDAISDNERKARERWERDRAKVEKEIEEHRRNIEENILQARDSYSFRFLTDLHFSSMLVANSAYRLLDDAHQSLNGISNMLIKAKERLTQLKDEIIIVKKEKNYERKKEIYEELKIVRKLRKSLFDDKDKVKEQKNHFYSEVKRLNYQTGELKYYIRDRCGLKGETWFERLEERKRERRNHA